MAEHRASVTVNASVHQVYGLFTHFNDFPKFMSFVKEVTYYDDQHSHWVAELLGRHEWDAVNENWVEDKQIGWRSTSGLTNSGQVTFQPSSNTQTLVDVVVNYDPPAGILGDAGEALGGGSRFENALQHDLNHFAEMVQQAPEGALDPMSSNFLFNSDSAAARGTTTSRQNDSMLDDSIATPNNFSSNATADTNNPTHSAASISTISDNNYDASNVKSYTTATSSTTDSNPGATFVPGGNPQSASTPYPTDQDILNESSKGLGGPTGRTSTRTDPGVRNLTNTSATTDTDYGTPVDMQDSSMATGRDEGSGSTNPRDLGNVGGGPNVGAPGLTSGSTTGRDTTLDDRTASNGSSDRDALANTNPTSSYQPERNLQDELPTGDRDATVQRRNTTDSMQSRDYRRNNENSSDQA